MTRWLLPLVSCFLLCLALTPVVRRAARRWGLVDRPDGRRKLHDRAIPLAGGLAVFTSVALVLGLLLVPGVVSGVPLVPADLVGLLLGCALICGLGVIDDLGRLRGRHKLLGQVLAIGVVMAFGVRIDKVVLFGHDFEMGALAVPFTMFMLLGAVNSLNLLDGMDGLLSSVGMIISLAMGVMAVANSQFFAGYVAFALAGALLGFLVFNFPPASVFLGDAGSMLIGLIIGVLAIQGSLKAPAAVALGAAAPGVVLAAPAAMLILPILDTLAAIIRRKLTGRSIYTTDRAHLHHCLLGKGMTNRRALLLICGLCLLAVLGGLGSVAFKRGELISVLSAAAVAGTLLVTRLFGHAELSLVKRQVESLVVSLIRPLKKGSVKEVSVRLHGDLEWDTLWVLITSHAEELNLCRVRLDVNAPAINERYHARWDRGHDESEEAGRWHVQLPLTVSGRVVALVDVVGNHDEHPIWQRIGVLAELLRTFEDKTARVAALAFENLAGHGPHRLPVGQPHRNGQEARS